MEIPEGFCLLIYARSGLATKHGLRPANCVGVIDSDYRGEIKVPLHCDLERGYAVRIYERVAQAMLAPVARVSAGFREVASLSETKRGTGGFGSTGVAL
jgi:dUTP pyrophosphatase